MCGLFGGYSSVLVPDEREVIQTLMILNYARGEDSTGMFDYVPNGDKINPGHTSRFRYWKTTDHPVDFARTRWKKADSERWSKSGAKVIAGHARAATRGKVSQNNAHPFVHSPIMGMHNGTIWGEFRNHNLFETDSEALIKNISEMGVKSAIEDLKSTHSAAYALVWIDSKEHQLHFLRNEKRPLHFARQGNNGSTVFWSSEALQLELALSYLKDAEKWEVMELPVNEHWTFDLTKDYIDLPDKEEIKLPIIKSYPTHTPAVNMGFQAWGEDEWDAYEKERKAKDAAKQLSLTDQTEHIPWDKYPDEDADEWPMRVVLGNSEGLSESYLLQYSTKTKEGMNQYWDVVSQRWLTRWGWHRLNSLRRDAKAARQAKLTVVADNTNKPDHPSLNDSLPEIMKPGYEEPQEEPWKDKWAEAAPWHVNGDEVSYVEWLQATKKGCTWERCVFVHDCDAVWLTKDYVLCEKHAKEALVKGSELNKFFHNHASVIKNGLKGLKRRLMNEIAIRAATNK